MTLFKNCLWNFDPSINMVLVNGDFLHYTDMKKFLRNLLLWNRLSDFERISKECSLGDPFQKLFAKFWSIHKHGSGEWGCLALYRNEQILRKSSSLKPLVRFWNNFTGMFLGWPFLKIVVKFWSIDKHGSGEWGLFLWNRWSNFEMVSQKCSLSDLSQKFWSVIKHGSSD